MVRIVHRVAVPVVLLAVLAAACGSEDASTTEASGSDETNFESPLADFMGFDWGGDFDQDAAQAQIEEQQRAVNEQIVSCMAAEGFEYIPEDTSDFAVFEGNVGPDGLEYGSDEWVAKYGFGISTQVFSQDMVGPELVGYDEGEFMEEGEFVDPNQEYVNSLSEADQEAFYETLYGNDPGPEISEGMTEEEMQAAFDEYEQNREPSGCMEKAYGDGFGFGDNDEIEFYEEFGDDLQAMYQRIDSHPRIVEAEREISDCVAGKGYTYSTMMDVYETFEKRLEPLYQTAFSEPSFDLTEEEVASMSEAELAELYRPPDLTAESKGMLAEIQAEEIAMAKAVNECGGGFDASGGVYNDVRIELEQEFIEANRDKLEAFKAEQG